MKESRPLSTPSDRAIVQKVTNIAMKQWNLGEIMAIRLHCIPIELDSGVNIESTKANPLAEPTAPGEEGNSAQWSQDFSSFPVDISDKGM